MDGREQQSLWSPEKGIIKDDIHVDVIASIFSRIHRLPIDELWDSRRLCPGAVSRILAPLE